LNPDSDNKVRAHSLRARLKEVVADTILEAAEHVFSEGGLETRLEDVATAAGVSVGTLYNYFTDRQALVEALIEKHRTNLRERLEAVVARDHALPLRSQLESIIAEIVAVSLQKLRLRLLLLQATPHRLMRHAETRSRLLAMIDPVLEKAREKGELAPDSNGLQVHLLVGLIHAALAVTQEVPPLLAPEALPKAIVSAFLDGVGGRGGDR
jgi:AcrR family transcriptional regulator